jgi:hypothetical protein
VTILVSSKRQGKGDEARPIVTTAEITCVGDMKPNLILSGPGKVGERTVYIGIDAQKIFFNTASGALVGVLQQDNGAPSPFTRETRFDAKTGYSFH